VTFGSRQKGARAERDVAGILEDWWRQIEPACIFKRTPGSGGWAAKGGARGEFGTAGDLVTTAKLFPWCVEVKSREAWVWRTLLAGKPSPVLKWWEQSCTAAAETPRMSPLLVFRHRREPWYVIGRSRELVSTLGQNCVSIGEDRSITRLDFILANHPGVFALPDIRV
jgi:hypothetical protein